MPAMTRSRIASITIFAAVMLLAGYLAVVFLFSQVSTRMGLGGSVGNDVPQSSTCCDMPAQPSGDAPS
jgi:hypothetical protein